MIGIANVLSENTAATVFGALGLSCQLAWPIFSARRSILTVQFGVGANYGIQYAMLEAWTGAGTAFLGATQTMVTLLAGERTWLRNVGLVFMPIVVASSCITWCGAISLLPLTSCLLVMLGRFQRDIIRLRICALSAAPFGMSYDLLTGAVPALVGAVTSAAIAACMLAREIQRRNAARPHRLLQTKMP